MHILKIIHGYPPTYNAGSEVYTQSIVNELKKIHKVTVFTREENPFLLDFNFRTESSENIDFIFVNMAKAKEGYNHKLVNDRFLELINKIKPDIAHIGHLNHLSTGIIDILYKQKIPIVFTLHDFWLMCPRGQFLQRNFDGKNLFVLCQKQNDNLCANSCYSMYYSGFDNKNDLEFWTNWINRRMKFTKNIIQKVNIFLAPSKYLMNRFINDFNLPIHKIKYLDYGFPTEYLKPITNKFTDVYTFGYIGTHIPAKGINLLIEAFKMLKGKMKLKIYGREIGQNTIALKKLAENSNNKIEFCGEYINKNLAKTVFSNIDCIVVPSIWAENSPLVIHEAQACKIPVITANIGGMAEYVNHKINGLLFEHRNVNSLAEQIQYAFDNQIEMKKLGQKGYLFSDTSEVIDIQNHCKILEEIYYQTIKNNV
jgi:glycosyltransferase involved in cell wall biosynthesis